MTNPATVSVKDLLAAATPLPWIRPWGSLKVHGLFGDDLFGRGVSPSTPERDVMNAQANLDLATFAVNHLPDYEAAVDALDRLLDAYAYRSGPLWADARAALARLRGES